MCADAVLWVSTVGRWVYCYQFNFCGLCWMCGQPLTSVFSQFVAMFNEPDGKWSQIYPERELQRFELSDHLKTNPCKLLLLHTIQRWLKHCTLHLLKRAIAVGGIYKSYSTLVCHCWTYIARHTIWPPCVLRSSHSKSAKTPSFLLFFFLIAHCRISTTIHSSKFFWQHKIQCSLSFHWVFWEGKAMKRIQNRKRGRIVATNATILILILL